MRKFVFAILLLLTVIFLIGRFSEIQAIRDTLVQGEWYYLFIALALEVVWLFNNGISYWVIYRMMGLDEKFPTLLLASSGAYFVNVVAPVAGVSGLAVFISNARKRGYSTARTTFASMLFLILDYGGFIIVLMVGLIILFRRNSLTTGEIIPSLILILFALFLTSLIFLAMRSEEGLGKVFVWISRLVNRFLKLFHRQSITENRAIEFAHEAASGINDIRKKPGGLIFPAVLAITNKMLLMLILLLMFKAFNVPLSIGTIIAGFTIGYLFVIVSPTPAGLGLVEGALTLVLSSMYIPLGAAAVVALAYRAITFWFPLAFGGLALRVLHWR